MPRPITRALALATVVCAAVTLVGCTAEQAAVPTVTPVAPATPSPSDSWAGYFDAEAASAEVGEYVWQSWGVFGDPGGVAPFRSDNQTLESGAYDVTLRCAGPETVTATISTSSVTAIRDPVSFPCGAAVSVSIDLPERGLLIGLDSDRVPGAFLIQVARAGE